MKICVIELIQKGGMVHYTSQLVNALSKKEDSLINCILPCGTDTSLFSKKVIITTIPTIGRHPYRIDLIMKKIFKFNPDIVHITIRHPFILPLLPIIKIMKKRVFLTIHDVTPHVGEKRILAEVSTSITAYFSDIIFVHGNKLKKDLLKKGIPDSKIIVIPHGDYSFFTQLVKKNIAPEENTILFFGRILDYKGLEYLIKAEPEITRQIPNLKIIIAGEGDLSNYEKMMINRDRYEIINRFISDDEVPCLFMRSELIVLPYIEASQSGVIPIAYSFGKPVVATNVGAIPEVIENGKTGLIIPSKDVSALSDAIVDLLKNKAKAKTMAVNGIKKMENELSWDEISTKIIEYYKV